MWLVCGRYMVGMWLVKAVGMWLFRLFTIVSLFLPLTFSSMPGSDVQLINFVMSCLGEQNIAHPDGLVAQLRDLLGQGKTGWRGGGQFGRK